ncbi:MAG: hypothetical protein AB2815_04170, partial [Candidatus Sedimenticola endophacoides]
MYGSTPPWGRSRSTTGSPCRSRPGRSSFYSTPTRVSLPRERFWDIPVPKIDSPTRQPLLPRP